jgi:hypothetical protein
MMTSTRAARVTDLVDALRGGNTWNGLTFDKSNKAADHARFAQREEESNAN